MHQATGKLGHNLNGCADLASLPRHRRVRTDAVIDRLRAAVGFDAVLIAGLDIDGFEYPTFKSTDSDLPPAFIFSYCEEGLFKEDPVVFGWRTC